jgi:hypothetical protein
LNKKEGYFGIFIPMKWIAFIFLTLCLQSVISPASKLVNLEDNSLYFKKGVYSDFLNDQLVRIREIQSEYPSLVFEFSLFQLESESHNLALNRHKTIVKRFQEARLDMNRIIFDSKTTYVKSFKDHQLSLDVNTLDSIGAVLEGKVLSLD